MKILNLRHFFSTSLLTLTLIAALTACGEQSAPIVESPMPTLEPTATAEPTPEPSPISAPVPTSTVAPTPAPTPEPTPTPVPAPKTTAAPEEPVKPSASPAPQPTPVSTSAPKAETAPPSVEPTDSAEIPEAEATYFPESAPEIKAPSSPYDVPPPATLDDLPRGLPDWLIEEGEKNKVINPGAGSMGDSMSDHLTDQQMRDAMDGKNPAPNLG